MAIKYLSDFSEDDQAAILQKHPEFHSYGLVEQQAALKTAKSTTNKRGERVVKAVRKNIAARTVTADLDKPAETPVAKPVSARVTKPVEKAATVSSPTQFTEENRENYLPVSEIRNALSKMGTSEPSDHANKLMSWAGAIEDSLSRMPVSGSDDPESANETKGNQLEPKHVRNIRKHLSRFYDAINKHNQYHTLAEYPGGSTRTSSVLRGEKSEAPTRFGSGGAYSTAVDPVTALSHRPLAKEFLKLAAQHLGDASSEAGTHMPEAGVHQVMPEYSVKDAALKVAEHYGAVNLGTVTPNIREVSKQLLMSNEQRAQRTDRNDVKVSTKKGLHKEQLTDDAKAELSAEHPDFDKYPETDELAATFQKKEDGTRYPSKDSVLRRYQAAGKFKTNSKEEKVEVEKTAYQQVAERRTPEQAFGLLLGGFRRARTGDSVFHSINRITSAESKARLQKERENAPAPDPNATDKYGFTEQQHYDAFDAAHQHYFTNNPTATAKQYYESKAYTHSAKYMADVSKNPNLKEKNSDKSGKKLRKSSIVQDSATALRALTAGFSIPKGVESSISRKPGLMDALNTEATRRQIRRAGHTAAFDAGRGAAPEREA